MNLKIYDELRKFQKNKVFKWLGRKDLTDLEHEALETLDGVLYLVEGVVCREE